MVAAVRNTKSRRAFHSALLMSTYFSTVFSHVLKQRIHLSGLNSRFKCTGCSFENFIILLLEFCQIYKNSDYGSGICSLGEPEESYFECE